MDHFDLRNRIKAHGILLPNNQVFLKEPLLGFKKLITYGKTHDDEIEHCTDESIAAKLGSSWSKVSAIANLIIPAGAIVNLPHGDKKIRANSGILHSLYRMSDKKKVRMAVSSYAKSFIYRPAMLPNFPSIKDKKAHVQYCIRSARIYNQTSRPLWMRLGEVFPKNNAFNTGPETCESGIHFFLELSSAKAYPV